MRPLTRSVIKWENLPYLVVRSRGGGPPMAGSVVQRPIAALACEPNRDDGRGRTASTLRWLAAASLLALATACSGSQTNGKSAPMRTATPATSASHPSALSPPASQAPRRAILAQYRAFWAHLTPASRAPRKRRREILAPYTANPELASLLSGISRDRSRGRVFYGQPILRATTVMRISPNRGIAVVRDCQDASHTGDKDLKSGRLLTQGAPHNLVVSTLHRFPDGIWRVAFVTFPRRQC